jgi:hypothetical protein
MDGIDESKLSEEMHAKLMQKMGNDDDQQSSQTGVEKVQSQEYHQFKKQYQEKHLSIYEQACAFAEKTFKMPVDEKSKPKLIEAIETCHLNVTPEGTASFALMVPIILFLVMTLFSFVVFGILMQTIDPIPFFAIIGMIMGVMFYSPAKNLPFILAGMWRMKASNQMVICVFYTVTYMRHTSNLENAVKFASDHIEYPLSLDLKKVIWDAETEKFESVRESLEGYLKKWKEYAPEFVESMHMIESSLLEGEEARRLDALDKALSNILEETYEKMLHYAHNLNAPLTTLNMLGVVMPILGLVILPLMVSLMETEWYYLSVIYNVLLFAAVFYLGTKILTSRPTGYGDSDISENNPAMKKFHGFNLDLGITKIQITPLQAGVSVGVFFLIVALLPILLYQINPYFDRDMTATIYSYSPDLQNIFRGEEISLLGYKQNQDGNKIIGPFGLFASILSFGFPLAAGLGFGTYFRLKSSNVIKIREQSKKLENEFAGALFQLSNRLGDGLPTEIAFQRVSETLEGSVSGNFFRTASANIQKMGMSVEEAIFDKEHGALMSFPSNLIQSTMKVLVEAAKKGPKIASEAMNNVSAYIKEMHKVDERLKDLLGETIASMKSQVKMLSPTISAIVVGVTSMIITILGKLGKQTKEMAAGTAGGAGNAGMISLFGDGIPTYFFQIVVGIYVVQVVFILTKIANGIENGTDKLSERYNLGQNMVKSTLIYVGLACTVVTAFTLLADTILQITAG